MQSFVNDIVVRCKNMVAERADHVETFIERLTLFHQSTEMSFRPKLKRDAFIQSPAVSLSKEHSLDKRKLTDA